jgi:hypothetical protein
MDDKQKLVRRLRLGGRGIGFTMVGFGGTALVGGAVSEYLEGGFGQPELEGVLLVVIGAVALAGMILTFWRERIGGIILVSVAAALGAHIANFAGSGHAQVWSMVGLPFLVAGVLFLNAWRISREVVKGASPS